MFKIGDVIHNKYRIVKPLGKSKMAKTYLAKSAESSTNALVVVKSLHLRNLKEWKILDLFKREAMTLKNLDHAKIPKYIDYFTEETKDDIIYFLVYEYIEGKSLTKLIDEGYKFDYDTVEMILTQILEILDYLHRLNPCIIYSSHYKNELKMSLL